MKGTESGKDKIQKICDTLRKETLEPAKQEAKEIVENAHLQAEEILKEAYAKAQERIGTAEKEIEERKKLGKSSLQLACRQAIEELKQKIERDLFNKQLAEDVARETRDPKVIAHLLASLIRAVEQKGIEEDFQALIPKEISPGMINGLLTIEVLEKLEKNSVSVGDFQGGIQLRLKGQKMTIDVSDGVIRELIGQYIRRDLRELIFQT
jgi:V/A-type H+-transporting ATPase subunit E